MKDGYITVRDRHFQGGSEEEECGEIRTSCRIGRQNSAIVIDYTEIFDGENDCRCALTIMDGRVTMMRSGAYRTTVVFEDGKRNTSAYLTPFGEILIGVFTNALFIDMTEEGGTMNIAYTLDSGGDLLSENELKISVELKDDDNVSIG